MHACCLNAILETVEITLSQEENIGGQNEFLECLGLTIFKVNNVV